MKSWMQNAACIGTDPDVFFQEAVRGRPGEQTQDTHAEARTICAECDVITQCLKWATDNREHGFLGGMSEAERDSARRRKARGMPDTRSTSPGQPRTGGAYTITPEDEARRRQLWKDGHTDAEIGVDVGRTTDVIREWRDRRGLKNNKPFTRTPKWVHQLRTSLYEAGRTDAEMAAVTKSTVPAIKAWRRKQRLPANRPATQTDQPRQKVTA